MDRGEIIIYQTADGETRLDVRMENDSVWLTQAQMAELFGTEVPAISKHVRNIFRSGELEREATVSKMEIVRQEGARTIRRMQSMYNLDVIISVGYRRSRTTRSATATSASPHSCSCGSWRTTAFSTAPTVRACWTTTRWSP